MKKRKSVTRKLKFPDVKGFNWEQFEAAIFEDLKKEYGRKNVRITKMEKDSTTFAIR